MTLLSRASAAVGPRHLRSAAVVAAALALLLVVAIIGLAIGAVPLSAEQVVQQLLDGSALITRYRLPRVLLGMVAGATLAASGCLLQTALRNVLAAPDVVGVTAGGGLAAVAALLVWGGLPAIGLTAVTLIGCALGGALVLLLAGPARGNPIGFALVGVAVGVGLGAITMLLLTRAAPEAGAAMTWLKGSLYARSLADAGQLLPLAGVGLVVAGLLSRQLNLLRLDDTALTGIGVRVPPTRLLIIAVAALLAATGVAAAGVLAFVGLIVPHLCRLLIGSDHRWLLPAAALLGAVLVAGCDTLGRWAFAPTEIPVGAIVATIGAPYFIWLVIRGERHSLRQ